MREREGEREGERERKRERERERRQPNIHETSLHLTVPPYVVFIHLASILSMHVT